MNDIQNNTIKVVEYLDGFQYAGGVLQFFPHAEGYVAATQGTKTDSNGNLSYIFNYVYNYTDHLGNIRLSYTKDPVSGELEIMEENHYYPFGLKHSVYAPPKQKYELDEEEEEMARPTYVYETEYQYKYNGKEWQDELGLGMYDYGARNYDPSLGRWMNVDPLAEQYRRWSPYNYAVNNPVKFTDPDGMAVEWIPGTDGKAITYTEDSSGKLSVSDNATEDTKQIVSGINDSGSQTAKDQFKGIADSEGKVNLVIDKANTGINGVDLYGVHQPHDADGNILNWDSDAGKFDGTPATFTDSNGNTLYSEATITIFESNFSDDVSKNSDQVLYELGIIDTPTKSDMITGTFSHEVDHNLNPNAINAVIDRANNISNSFNVEAPAEEVERKVHKEIRDVRP